MDAADFQTFENEALLGRLRAYRGRIEFLKNEALKESISVREDSLSDFRSFLVSTPATRLGSLTMSESGTVRATWKDGRGSHVALHFLGGNVVQYVLFSKYADSWGRLSRTSGCAVDRNEIMKQITAFNLDSLLFG